MRKEEALELVRGYLYDYFPSEQSDRVEEICNALADKPKMEIKEWDVYIYYVLSRSEKLFFIGTKEQLMTLIGCIHSKSLEQCSVWYFHHQDGVKKGNKISYQIGLNEEIYLRREQ